MVNTPSGEGGGSSVVVVGEAWLVRFLQYLSQNPAKERALARLEALSPAQRQQLIDAYVREECCIARLRRLAWTRTTKRYVSGWCSGCVQRMRFLLEAAAVDGTRDRTATARALPWPASRLRGSSGDHLHPHLLLQQEAWRLRRKAKGSAIAAVAEINKARHSMMRLATGTALRSISTMSIVHRKRLPAISAKRWPSRRLRLNAAITAGKAH